MNCWGCMCTCESVLTEHINKESNCQTFSVCAFHEPIYQHVTWKMTLNRCEMTLGILMSPDRNLIRIHSEVVISQCLQHNVPICLLSEMRLNLPSSHLNLSCYCQTRERPDKWLCAACWLLRSKDVITPLALHAAAVINLTHNRQSREEIR